MHHKMRRGWSTPYVGLKKCRSHLLLEVQKTSLPFWKTFTINNVSWLIKDHYSLLRIFPFLFFYNHISYLIIVLSPSFLSILSRFSPTRNTHKKKNNTHSFLWLFFGKSMKSTHVRSAVNTHVSGRSARVLFFSAKLRVGILQIDRKLWLVSRYKTGKRDETNGKQGKFK